MGVKEKNKRVGDLVDRSVENLSELIDVNAVVGRPIVTSGGFRLIPVSKVTVGYLTGGGEYGDLSSINSVMIDDTTYDSSNGEVFDAVCAEVRELYSRIDYTVHHYHSTETGNYMIANLHTLTVRTNPDELRKNILNLIAIYIAAGLDPEKNNIFIQRRT